MSILSIPLSLTLTRVALSPLFLVVYLYHQEMGISLFVLPYFLMFLVIICELSDLFDGILARKKNQVTDLGKILDPMADSIFRLSVFMTFTQGLIKLPILLVLVFFYRDSIISTLRTVCALRGVALAARFSGKVKAVVQAATAILILLLMIPYSLGLVNLALLREVSFYTVLVTAVYTVISGIEYVYANRSFIRKAIGLT
ncbi:MAG: CDP-alcohol phosphatidyltransferase family protein [Chlamydiota bacterium]